MDKKLLFFLVGFFALFFAYQKFIIEPMVKKQRMENAAAAPAAGQTQTSEAANPPAESPVAATTAPAPAAQMAPSMEASARKITVETPLYRAEFSNRGGVLTSFRLKKYTDDQDQPLEMIPQEKDGPLPLTLDFDDKAIAKIADDGLYQVDRDQLTLSGQSADTISFSFSDGTHSFHKSIRFQADNYLLQLKVDASTGATQLPVRVVWSPGIESLESYKSQNDLRPTEGLYNTGEKVERKAAKKIEGFQKVAAAVRWAGLENSYFAAIFIPGEATDAYLNQVGASDRPYHNLTLTMASQKAGAQQMQVFIGPKDYLMLKSLGSDLEHAVDFGFYLAPIVKALFFSLRKLHEYTNNYGWAIVILTIVIKLIFTPFMQKSFASQKKMQAMQPEMKQIQDKYAKMKNDDPRKAQMNTEVMALHKRYGVNPLGGCLPMLIQMPVLIGFYRLLSGAIELRHAPFLLWLTDLSKPDPYYITPLLMGGSMLIQQRMTPVSDPMQKNMMFIMPVMFTFMSFKLQSGLVLYWLLSNILGLLHQSLFQWQQRRVAAREGNAK